MSRHPHSDAIKAKVVRDIEKHVGETRVANPPRGGRRRMERRETADGSTFLFLTHASVPRRGTPFYDVRESDLEHWLDYPRAFILFVLGSGSDVDVFVVPVEDLAPALRARVVPNGDGDYKLHLHREGREWRLKKLPGFDLMAYRNRYDLLSNSSPTTGMMQVSPFSSPAPAREFSVVIERDVEGYYVASVPALAGCHTQARSLDVLMERVQEAIELCLEEEGGQSEPLDFVGVQRIAIAA